MLLRFSKGFNVGVNVGLSIKLFTSYLAKRCYFAKQASSSSSPNIGRNAAVSTLLSYKLFLILRGKR
jgi:hypothetical protein